MENTEGPPQKPTETSPGATTSPSDDDRASDYVSKEVDEKPTAPGRRHEDAHVDRVLLFPTAETHPGGSFFVSSYEVVLLQFGYALSDRTQAALLLLPPLFVDQPFFLSPNLKTNIYRSEKGNIALLGALDVLASEGEGTATVRFGAVGQACFEPGCRSSLSFTAEGGALPGDDSDTFAAFGLGATIALSGTVSLLFEPLVFFPFDESSRDGEGMVVLSYGVRFSSPQFGLDLGLLRPFLDRVGSGDEVFALGFPLVAATYRP